MWQDWLINYFHDGSKYSNFVLLYFVRKEVTFWINGKSVYERL